MRSDEHLEACGGLDHHTSVYRLLKRQQERERGAHKKKKGLTSTSASCAWGIQFRFLFLFFNGAEGYTD